MASSIKAIKTRISSVKNTKKITKAMQMIAATKLKKAADAMGRSQAFASLAINFLGEISNSVKHKLLLPNSSNRELLIVISSNRGLCGSYNSNIFKKLASYVSKSQNAPRLDVIAVGKKAASFSKKLGLEVTAIYEKLNENFKFEDSLPISLSAIEMFLEQKYSSVKVIYTKFISGLKQSAEIVEILPLSKGFIKQLEGESNKEIIKDFVFEPSKDQVLNYILPMILKLYFFQCILESTASEHSSRMIAMDSATNSASDMISFLTLEFNKTRQALITQEISEIVAGSFNN